MLRWRERGKAIGWANKADRIKKEQIYELFASDREAADMECSRGIKLDWRWRMEEWTHVQDLKEEHHTSDQNQREKKVPSTLL